MLTTRIIGILGMSIGLLSAAPAQAHAQAAPARAVPDSLPPSPRLLLKAGLRLTHLFYQPGRQSWQLVLPSSFGIEYRLQPQFSLYAQVEADVSATRGGRGRRSTSSSLAPTPSTGLGVGARFYFNQPSSTNGKTQTQSEPWGSYLALEASADATQLAQRGRRGRGGVSFGQVTPALFALYGTQRSGPGRHLLFDLNAGLGIEAPPAYTFDSKRSRPWDVAAQVNLRVYAMNHRRSPKPSKR